MDSLNVADEQSKAVQKTPNRVSLEDIQDKVSKVEYLSPPSAPQFTIAIVYMSNGYIVLGESAPADPANFNEELGKKFAYENAIRKVWPLEGYLLCQKLSDRRTRAEDDGVSYDD